MPRPEKVQAVAEIKERMEAARAVFLTEFRGLSVQQLQDLRRDLRNSGAEYKVVKMTLARLAADELGLSEIDEYLSGPTALTFADTDPVSTAKVLKDAGGDLESLVIKAGLLGTELILPERISELAEIEPRDVLLAKIAGAAKAPLFKAAGMFGSFSRDAATMFSQLLEKKESGEVPSASADEDAPATDDEPAASAEEE